MDIFSELEQRGLVQDATNRQELQRALANESVTFYAGYDPTGSSLHAGSLVPIMLQSRLQKAGHKPIVLVGGATGMVGDPSGKSDERSLLDSETLARNAAALKEQLSSFLEFGDGPTDAVLVDNKDWLGKLGFLEFLRDAGKLLTVNYMMAKDSVKARLNDRDQGISYTEFTYMLLQAYDFVHLAKEYGCRLQVGGSDQWGNITAGIEMNRKMGRDTVYGITAPLLLDANGEKMGKTAGGTRVWLDPKITSPYSFYQYWRSVSDADVAKLLRLFCPLPLDDITELVAEHAKAPNRYLAQKQLAQDITTWVHGADATRRAESASQVLFGGSLDDLRDADLEPLLCDVPSTAIPKSELSDGINVVELFHRAGLAASKGASRRLLSQGGGYINNIRVEDIDLAVNTGHLATESMMLLRAGKKQRCLVRVT